MTQDDSYERDVYKCAFQVKLRLLNKCVVSHGRNHFHDKVQKENSSMVLFLILDYSTRKIFGVYLSKHVCYFLNSMVDETILIPYSPVLCSL